jgi:ribosome-interacting GTPase 1
MHNCELLFREDATTDDLIDVIEGNRKYIKCLYVYNKIDTVTIEDVDRLARLDHSTVIACEHNGRQAVRLPSCDSCDWGIHFATVIAQL